MRWMRRYLQRFTKFFRRSMQARIVATSLALSTLALIVVFGYMSVSVGNNLFETRRHDIVSDASRASTQMQQVFSEGVTQNLTGTELDVLQDRALEALTGVTSSGSGSVTEYAMLRALPGNDSALTMSDVQSEGFDTGLVSTDLSEALDAPGDTPYYQSVALTDAESTQPAIMVGTAIDVPIAGRYELYLLTSLQATQDTLSFMQLTMAIGGVALIALIGAITWVVTRMVIGPMEAVVTSSARIAAGELSVRIPVEGSDELARLGRSFNDMADSMLSKINELATLSTVQQRFVSDVSHELRTPLTTIRLAGDVLHDRRDEYDAVSARTVELLHTQIERFEKLLADLLELSRFDAGASQLEVEPTNLVHLAQGEIDAVQTLALERGSELRLAAPGGHFDAEVDPRRIRRILQNFLGNAIDYGDGRPIVVTVDSNADAAAIAVRDHGAGMEPADAARVFDRFWRRDPSRQRRTGGTGLGLSISRDDAALHGGTIDVWSQPGVGTAFRLTLPRSGAATIVSPIELPPADTQAMTLQLPASGTESGSAAAAEPAAETAAEMRASGVSAATTRTRL